MSKYSFVNQELTNPSWQGLKHEWIDNGGVIVTVQLHDGVNIIDKEFTFEDIWEQP